MARCLVVKVDTNDGDFVSKVTPITDEQLAEIRPFLASLANFEPYEVRSTTFRHNFPYGECRKVRWGEKSVEELYGDTEALELFCCDFLPYCEYGMHTIHKIEIVDQIETLFELDRKRIYGR